MKVITARLSSTCKLCEKRVNPGDKVARFIRAWVHVNCAERHLEQNRSLTELPTNREAADRPQMTYVRGTNPSRWNGRQDVPD